MSENFTCFSQVVNSLHRRRLLSLIGNVHETSMSFIVLCYFYLDHFMLDIWNNT